LHVSRLHAATVVISYISPHKGIAIPGDCVKPAVTVLIDTYNHERFIEEAIVSVLDQNFPRSDVEIIVVDDGSTDRTAEIVAKFEPRVRLIRKANGGQASAFNAGIPEARGEIVAFLDGDDWWAPNKLSRVMQAMSADPAVGIVGHGITIAHPGKLEQSHTLREGFRFRANSLEGARIFRSRKAFLGTSRMTIRAELLRRIGAVPEKIAIQADEYLFTLGATIAPGQILPEPLTYYRVHDANGFFTVTTDSRRERIKQESLAVLARSLDERLAQLGIEPRVRAEITGITRSEADRLRLILDGGWPWETVKTEWEIYQVTAVDPRPLHRAFKAASLLLALAIPPSVYYGAQRKLTQSDLYLRVRKRWFPVAGLAHVDDNWRAGI
jgi:glycosyltransferase involved in cell wall biosynthesis